MYLFIYFIYWNLFPPFKKFKTGKNKAFFFHFSISVKYSLKKFVERVFFMIRSCLRTRILPAGSPSFYNYWVIQHAHWSLVTDSSSVTFTTQREVSTSHISTQTTSTGSTSPRGIVTVVSAQYNVSTAGTETTQTRWEWEKERENEKIGNISFIQLSHCPSNKQ